MILGIFERLKAGFPKFLVANPFERPIWPPMGARGNGAREQWSRLVIPMVVDGVFTGRVLRGSGYLVTVFFCRFITLGFGDIAHNPGYYPRILSILNL